MIVFCPQYGGDYATYYSASAYREEGESMGRAFIWGDIDPEPSMGIALQFYP